MHFLLLGALPNFLPKQYGDYKLRNEASLNYFIAKKSQALCRQERFAFYSYIPSYLETNNDLCLKCEHIKRNGL